MEASLGIIMFLCKSSVLPSPSSVFPGPQGTAFISCLDHDTITALFCSFRLAASRHILYLYQRHLAKNPGPSHLAMLEVMAYVTKPKLFKPTELGMLPCGCDQSFHFGSVTALPHHLPISNFKVLLKLSWRVFPPSCLVHLECPPWLLSNLHLSVLHDPTDQTFFVFFPLSL